MSRPSIVLAIILVTGIVAAESRRPSPGSFLITAHWGIFTPFYSSTISEQENAFKDYFKFVILLKDSSGNVKDTVDLSYTFNEVNLTGDVSYFLNEAIAPGLFYRFGWLSENPNYEAYKNSDNTILMKHSIGAGMTIWICQFNLFSISASVFPSYEFGYLTRFAALKNGYSSDDPLRTLIRDSNKSLFVNGFGVVLRARISLTGNGGAIFHIEPQYNFSRLSIEKNQLQGYPAISIGHSLSIGIGFGYLTRGHEVEE